MATQVTLNPESEDAVTADNAHKLLLKKGELRWRIDGHIVTRDSDGLWWTDPYGRDCGLYDTSREGVRSLIHAIIKWNDPLTAR